MANKERAAQASGASEKKRLVRSYRLLLVASVSLAVIGAPVFMHGAVTLAQAVAAAQPAGWSGAIVTFALCSTPLALAGVAWRRTEICRRAMEDHSEFEWEQES